MRALLALPILVALASSAEAKSGVYTGLGLGMGTLSGNKLVLNQTAEDVPTTDVANCCASAGAAAEFRLGFSIEGLIAPEFAFLAYGFDFASSAGGEGFIGGGLRLFPLGLVGLAAPSLKDFPVLISVGGIFGYTVLGKDFAYTGTFLAMDLTAEYRVTEVFSIGARLSVVPPSFGNFVYTDYNGNVGRCLDSNGIHDPTIMLQSKENATCTGASPGGLYLSPQLSMTFHFDVVN